NNLRVTLSSKAQDDGWGGVTPPEPVSIIANLKPEEGNLNNIESINFSILAESEFEGEVPPIKLELVDKNGYVMAVDLAPGQETFSLKAGDFAPASNNAGEFDWENVIRLRINFTPQESAVGDISFENFRFKVNQTALITNEGDRNLFIEKLLPLAKWSKDGIIYLEELLSNETTRSVVENWAVVAPKAKELIWRDLVLDYFNIKDEGILGGIILAAQEKTGKKILTSADILSTIESLRENFDNQAGSDYFSGLNSREKEVRTLFEGALGRTLDPKSYKDKLALDYWVRMAEVKGIDFVTSNFSERKKLTDTPKKRAELIAEMANRAGGGIAQQLSLGNVGSWDWSWFELAAGGTADGIVETIVGGAFMKQLLEKSLYANIVGSQEIATVLNLNDKIQKPLWSYFTEYLPYSGASERQVIRFILSKMKSLPYDAISVNSPEDGSSAISSAGKTSFNAFAEGNPFTSEEQKRMLLLSPVIKELLGELLGKPESSLPIGEAGTEFLDRSLEQLIAYFVDMRDISTGIMADAMGGTDNSMGTTGFLAMAALMGAEKGEISREKANQIVSAIVDFISTAQGEFGLLYHYYRPQTDERAGNSEVSLIDTYLVVAALTAYRNWDGAVSDTVEKINDFIKSIRLDEILKKADRNGSFEAVVSSSLNFAWTPERGLSAGDVNFYNEYILAYLIGIGSAQENSAELVKTLVTQFKYLGK
ncbi:MAG: hypothetical protein NTZ48_02695, partial [Candidatus Omnitrophica bacterium]|nr:hypothetical protein [Candidatus Omnitrophota bacterium]